MIINLTILIMSGDNLYGKQPLKFYSNYLTLTKISLLKFNHNKKYSVSNLINSDHINIDIKNKLSD